MNYKYLVCAALQEELNAFFNVTGLKPRAIENELEEVILIKGDKEIPVVAYTSNKMGMPYNSAMLMQVILDLNPKFILFIGTCAGLAKHPIGTVLVPHKIFTYESGKFNEGQFMPDFTSFDTSDLLRKEAEILKNQLRGRLGFNIVTDDDFCSGSAVINDKEKIDQILKNGARKLSGLDMEAYSIACIDNILQGRNELLVIKGISDLAHNKGADEEKGNKELAKINSAKFACELILSIEERGLGNDKLHDALSIVPSPNYDGPNVPIKIVFNIRNITHNIVSIHSEHFDLNPHFSLPPRTYGIFKKPVFRIGYKKNVKGEFVENYTDVCVLKPGESVESCWFALDLNTNKEDLNEACRKKSVGIWKYSTGIINQNLIQCKNKLLV